MSHGTGPVLIMAGGTGGHVFPGLAVAAELRQRQVPVVWLGTAAGVEAHLVPAAGIPLEELSVAGLRGKGLARLVAAPWMLLRACLQAGGILRRLRPRVVLGLGGFAAGPGGLMARLLGVPLCIHEQNAVAGLTNRLLAPLAGRVLEGFPGSFGPGRRAGTVGNPVRPEIAALPPPEQRMAGRSGPLRVLVLGGSLGAQALNRAVPAALARLPGDCRIEIRHQAGRGAKAEEARAAYAAAGVEAEVLEFVDDMAAAYGWADLVICRAGALTIAELAAAGVASVLVPYPHAVDDHQTRNARHLAAAGAAVLVPQDALDPGVLGERIAAWCRDRGALVGMARRARALATVDAAARVADACLALARGRAPGEGAP